MNQEVKAKWVAALRSGEYRQCKDKLATQSRKSHCCLGVLCELAVKEGVIPEPIVNHAESSQEYNGVTATLPVAVACWAGLGSLNPILGSWKASSLNDVHGASFSQIADLIEAHL